MTMEEIIKAMEDKDLGKSVISAVKGLDTTAEVDRLKGELEGEQGKNSGILADKKKFKERAETAEGKLNDLEKDKLPAEERHERELKEMRDKLDAEKVAREKQDADYKLQQRESTLADLTGSIKWAEGTPHETAKLVIKNALANIDDLSDKSKVDEILTGVKDTHKSFIAAEAPTGTGGKPSGGGGGGGDDDKPATMQDLVDDAWAGK